ncbi:MAG TPA: short-chain dehydrogenase, partial [Alicycliphilus sp.]|nr:short-chain dehydrogenase [Alicycliphilus sp.]
MQSLPAGYRALVLGASGAIGGALAAQLRDDPYCAKMLTLGRSTTPAVDFDAPP